MADEYKIGVKLLLSSNHAQVLSALSKSLLGVNAQVNQLTGGFSKLKLAIGGALGVFAGKEILGGLTDIIEKTKDLSHELTQIKKLGIGADDFTRAGNQALATSRDVRGVTQTDALRIYGQTFSLIGADHARAINELLAKYGVVMGNTLGDATKGMSGFRDLVRAAEQTGRLTDPTTGNVDMQRFRRFLDLATRVGVATHGQVGPRQWYQIAQQGGPALMGMADRDLETMAILSQYMGGPRAGTATMSLFQQFAGGTMYSRQADELQRLGILHEGEWEATRGGGVILTPETRKRLGALVQHPLDFVTKTLVPAMAAKGITAPDDQIREVFSIIGRQTSQREVADLTRNWRQMLGEMGRIDSGMGLSSAYKAANRGDVEQNLNNLSAAWNNLLYAIGGPQSANVIAFLNSLTGITQNLANAANANPGAVKAIAEGIGILGAALIGIGAVAIIGAIGAGGWFVGGVIALGAAFAMFHTQIADAVKAIPPNVMAIASVLTLGLVPALLNLIKVAGYDWKGTFGHLIDGLQSLWDKLKSFLSGAGNSVGPMPGSPGFKSPYGSFAPMSYVVPNTGGAAVTGPFGGLHSGGGYTINGSAGSGTGAYVGGNGQGGWWTPAREGFAVNYLMRNAGLPELSARALVARWAGVESTARGPWAANGMGGGHIGIGQWGPNRRSGVRLGDFVGQLAHAAAELKGPEGRALHMLLGAKTPLEAAIAASQFERAEHYNLRTGADAWVGKTLRALPHIPGESQADSPFIPPAQQKEHVHHTTLLLDGRVLAQNTLKHVVGMGNRPSQGARLADYSGTRPQSV